MKAQQRYDELATERQLFLDVAHECSQLTLPYLISRDNDNSTHKRLFTPWQSVGAKSVVTLASKLMLALLPPQTSFFKLQVRDDKFGEDLDPQIRSELDMSFSKMERMVMDSINGSNDRVVVHQAVKHLIVGGNSLIFMGKDGLKNYPLNRFVVDRDGNGNVIEIVTKERISRKILGLPMPAATKPNAVSSGGGLEGQSGSNPFDEDVEVYTHVKLDKNNGRWTWYQEAEGKQLPDSRSTAPKKASPWLVLRFNTFDGEAYGRGRVEEFLGDLKSLEALSQALVEGSAAAAKVVFLVSPSSTTKPQTLAKAGNGAIIQGRPDDVQVVQVGKTADFKTAYDMANQLGQRIQDAFMVLNIRQSERTTAEEVRLTQLELEQQLGGLFSLLTVEFLKPYLDRTLMVLQRSGQLPKLPKGIVNPTIVAGVNALGRGQDRESLISFITTIAQTMGPEAIQKYVNPDEYIKRLATAQGIDILNLVKSMTEVQGEMQQAQQMVQQNELVKQAGQFASAPMMDPTKNPQAQEMMNGIAGQGAAQADPNAQG
tara:strand:- start:1686 stop:3311 length:1626 start_codon:yes stop_codon:yes gene_type:complete